MRKIIGIFGALICVSRVPAQDNTIRVDTRLVQVTATVHDKHGAVGDLTKSDFEILDKGKQRMIATFAVARSASLNDARRPPSSLPPNTYTNRLDQKGDPPVAATVILFDQLNTAIKDQNYARQNLIGFLKSIDPQSPVAIYTLGNRLRILHDFTDDRQRLAAALAGLRNDTPTLLENSSTASLAAGISTSQATPDAVGQVSVSVLTPEMLASMLEPLESYAIDRRASITLSAMGVIASRLSGVPGRKNLLWVSGGFPLVNAFDRSGINGSAGRLVTYASQMKEAASAIDRADVSIYPVDARGLKVDYSIRTQVATVRDQRGGKTNNQTTAEEMISPEGQEIETMKALADWTGGKAFYNTNNLTGALKQAIEDSEVVYTLGFYVDQKDIDGAYHELKVKVRKSKNGGDDVRYRHGYFATPLPAAQTAGTILTDAALAPADSTGIGLTASLTPQASAPGSYLLALAMDLNTLRLEEKNGKWAGGISVGIIQQAVDGKVLDTTANTIALNLTPENREKLMKDGLTLTVGVTPAPGMVQIRTAVLDQVSGNVGSLRIPGPK